MNHLHLHMNLFADCFLPEKRAELAKKAGIWHRAQENEPGLVTAALAKVLFQD